MVFKERTESILLRILRILHYRGDMTPEEEKYYWSLEKGYEGECQFDRLTEKLQNESYVLNDLLLEFNNKEFQIDTTIIHQGTIFLFEIKNLEGDYSYAPDNFQMVSGKEISNPLDQLKRSKSLFHQLLQHLRINLEIEAYVVFINPEFTLYQAPMNIPFIFPTQITRFLKKLDMKPSHLNSSHQRLAEKLVSLHKTESANSKLPSYDYQQLKKGITCKTCYSFSVYVEGRNVVCSDCGGVELISAAVMRSVEELRLLFPERKITTNLVHEWCGVVESKKRIRRILHKNFTSSGVRQWSYFEIRKDRE
ncbi:nuclease-related domain-containing protein [Neobacillus sp. D3-1R]|uniref:nuclease-related domain-containing protein n=1 Tax=Neobacillus sp. D3-1R TaxID=3445778 RepID=UPI003F9F4DDE